MPLSEWPDKFKDAKDQDDFESVDFGCEMVVLAETGKAVGIGSADEVEYWIPKSQIEPDEVPHQGEMFKSLSVKSWYAGKLRKEMDDEGGD